MAEALPQLSLACYRLGFQALESVNLPPFTGSTWRGAFGHALRGLVCVTREPVCESCLLYRSCIYPYVFETPPDPTVGKLTRYTAAPHPYLLAPPWQGPTRLEAGQPLELEVTLFGRSNQYLPHVVQALSRAGERGLGQGRGRLALQEVAQAGARGWQTVYRPGGHFEPLPADCPPLPPWPGRVRLTFVTPLRLRVQNRHLTAGELRFKHLFGQLLRRISLLTAFHTDTPLETDFAGLTRLAREVELGDTDLQWRDWNRYSSRQDKALQMGGLLGHLDLAGDGLEPFWPYLWLGQWTQVGKGTVMGMGRYRLDVDGR